jgi:hypothetical protein
MDTKRIDEIAVKAWITAVECGGDPDEWRGLLGLTWEELVYYADPTVVANAVISKYKENMLAFFPEPIRPFVVITTPKHRRPIADGTGSSTGGISRGKAYTPKLSEYRWQYKGKLAVIRRQGDAWMAEYDGQNLGVHPSHTQAVEAVYRANGVTAAINAVKLARMREQEAAAGLAD